MISLVLERRNSTILYKSVLNELVTKDNGRKVAGNRGGGGGGGQDGNEKREAVAGKTKVEIKNDE